MDSTAWNLKPALVLWQRGNLTLLKGGKSQQRKCVWLVPWPAVSGDLSILPRKQRPQGRCVLRNRTHQSYVTVGDKALCAQSHLQGDGVEIYVPSTAMACQAGSGGLGRAVQMTSICVSLTPGREPELVVQSGQTRMALIQLSHADITSFFGAV